LESIDLRASIMGKLFNKRFIIHAFPFYTHG
jgi:hypothetical protein